jgi:hypothetical protein
MDFGSMFFTISNLFMIRESFTKKSSKLRTSHTKYHSLSCVCVLSCFSLGCTWEHLGLKHNLLSDGTHLCSILHNLQPVPGYPTYWCGCRARMFSVDLILYYMSPDEILVEWKYVGHYSFLYVPVPTTYT